MNSIEQYEKRGNLLVSQVSRAPMSQARFGHPLRILVAGNAPLQIDALTHLLSTRCDDFQLHSPLYSIEQVLLYLQHTEPVDVILLLCSQLPQDGSLLQQLQQARQRCLLVGCFVPTPSLLARFKEAGAWGMLEATCSLADLSSAIRVIALGRTAFPQAALPQRRAAHPSLSSRQSTALKPSHRIIFAPRVLEECAQSIGWTLSAQERAILGHFFEGTEEMTKTVGRSASSIRHTLSARSYDFLSLLANAPVRDRAGACRTLLEWGIHQVMVADAALSPE